MRLKGVVQIHFLRENIIIDENSNSSTNFVDQYFFSDYELQFLAKDKDDIVSKFLVPSE